MAVALAAVLAPLDGSAQDGAAVHLRIAAGYDVSRETRFGDRACEVDPLLNFFGCQPGADERPIGAPGDFGGTGAIDVAVGARLVPLLRVEVGATHRPGFRFAGNATFLDTGEQQPVEAESSSTTLIARAIVDVGAIVPTGRLEPFAGVGIGGSRNRIADVVYEFPELPAQPATTTTVGGTGWSRAWDVNAGIAVRIGSGTRLEGAYRYSDLGHVTTDDGAIDVVRGARQVAVENVAGTRARLRVHGVWLGVRQDF